jgi:hypothetical protein
MFRGQDNICKEDKFKYLYGSRDLEAQRKILWSCLTGKSLCSLEVENVSPKPQSRQTMCPRTPIDPEILGEARKCRDALNTIANGDWDTMARINVEYYGDQLPLRALDHFINSWKSWLDAAGKDI